MITDMSKNSTSGKKELLVVIKSKDLCKYIMTVTQKSPKSFRFTYISRLQNLSITIVEMIYRANEVYVSGDRWRNQYEKRREYQQQALTDLRLLGYMAQMALEQRCILQKQFEIITRNTSDCQNLMKAWISSDKKRFEASDRTRAKETQ